MIKEAANTIVKNKKMKPYIKATFILSAKPYEMEILFSNGLIKNNALAIQVLNKNYFMGATVSKYGAIEWPNGFDVSPLSL